MRWRNIVLSATGVMTLSPARLMYLQQKQPPPTLSSNNLPHPMEKSPVLWIC